MAAQEAGAKISMIRLLDLNIKSCSGCLACAFNLQGGGPGDCVIKDDLSFLDEHILESDGIILAAPVFALGPPGLIKIIADRRGPSHDVSWRLEAKKIWEARGKTGKGPDERSFKKHVAGFISCGGATTRNWLSFQFPMLHLFTFSSDIKGDILIKGDKIDIVFSEAEKKESRLTLEGKAKHGREIMDVAKALAPHRDKIPARMEKYKAYTKCIVKAPAKAPAAKSKKK